MRKEFEENEESKKTLENNLEIQDEIDDETFQKILEEEFIEREKQIEEALFADEDFEDLKLTDKEVQDSYQELMRRFEENKKKSAEFSEELVPDEKKVRKILDGKSGSSDVHENKKVLSMEEAQERKKKTAGGLHRFGKVIIDNNEENEKASSDEEKAIADIEEKLGVKVPEFYYRPYGFEFSEYMLDELTSLARIEYKYAGSVVTLVIDKQETKTASKINSLDGDEKENVIIENEGVSILLKKLYNQDNTYDCSAEWHQEGTAYLLFGKIDFEEIKKIIEKMKF